jgi:hypothetical protein
MELLASGQGLPAHAGEQAQVNQNQEDQAQAAITPTTTESNTTNNSRLFNSKNLSPTTEEVLNVMSSAELATKRKERKMREKGVNNNSAAGSSSSFSKRLPKRLPNGLKKTSDSHHSRTNQNQVPAPVEYDSSSSSSSSSSCGNSNSNGPSPDEAQRTMDASALAALNQQNQRDVNQSGVNQNGVNQNCNIDINNMEDNMETSIMSVQSSLSNRSTTSLSSSMRRSGRKRGRLGKHVATDGINIQPDTSVLENSMLDGSGLGSSGLGGSTGNLAGDSSGLGGSTGNLGGSVNINNDLSGSGLGGNNSGNNTNCATFGTASDNISNSLGGSRSSINSQNMPLQVGSIDTGVLDLGSTVLSTGDHEATDDLVTTEELVAAEELVTSTTGVSAGNVSAGNSNTGVLDIGIGEIGTSPQEKEGLNNGESEAERDLGLVEYAEAAEVRNNIDSTTVTSSNIDNTTVPPNIGSTSAGLPTVTLPCPSSLSMDADPSSSSSNPPVFRTPTHAGHNHNDTQHNTAGDANDNSSTSPIRHDSDNLASPEISEIDRQVKEEMDRQIAMVRAAAEAGRLNQAGGNPLAFNLDGPGALNNLNPPIGPDGEEDLEYLMVRNSIINGEYLLSI